MDRERGRDEKGHRRMERGRDVKRREREREREKEKLTPLLLSDHSLTPL